MDILELIKAAIIGIVEGITEWLPISSTGHMILADEFIQLNVSPEFWEMFLVVIQLGAILAVIILYFNKLNPFAPSKAPKERRKTWSLWAKVVVGCVPAAVIGIALDDFFTATFHNAITVAIALVVYGVAFIVIERIKGEDSPSSTAARGRHSPGALQARASSTGEERRPSALQQNAHSQSRQRKRRGGMAGGDAVSSVDDLGFGRALGIGFFQCLAIIPGTSRSGSTILGGRILNVSREAAAEFSFFLAIPVMFGWSLLKIGKAFVFDGLVLTGIEWGVFVVGILVAFAVSVFAIKFLMSFIRKHSFEVFGWYRIVLGIVVIIFFAATGQLLVMQ